MAQTQEITTGFVAATSLALACLKHQVFMVSCLRWDAALYHWPEPHPTGKPGRKPLKAKRQRELAGLGGPRGYALGGDGSGLV